MTQRDYNSSPLADSLGLKAVISDLCGDLADLRAGAITPADAHARSQLAKQIFNGVRLYLSSVPAPKAAPMIEDVSDEEGTELP
jgi:hypothetical protein